MLQLFEIRVGFFALLTQCQYGIWNLFLPTVTAANSVEHVCTVQPLRHAAAAEYLESTRFIRFKQKRVLQLACT